MDRKAMFEKNKKALKTVGLLALFGVAGGSFYQANQKFGWGKKVDHGLGEGKGAVTHWWGSIKEKVNDVAYALDENDHLRMENASLRRWAESLRFDCTVKDSQNKTKNFSLRLSQETRSRVGRVLSTINYRPPNNRMPDELYTLGVSYFKAGEFEKAAVIFTFLTGMEDSTTYQTAENFLVTAITWYRLDNFQLADGYLQKVVGLKPVAQNLPYQTHARLWKALTAKKLDREGDSQKWLRELVDHHPHSLEAQWVNPQRGIASKAHEPEPAGKQSGHDSEKAAKPDEHSSAPHPAAPTHSPEKESPNGHH